jgi:hypothetical protein
MRRPEEKTANVGAAVTLADVQKRAALSRQEPVGSKMARHIVRLAGA